MAISLINDLIQLGRIRVLQSMREMLEEGDNLNNISYDILIKDQEEKELNEDELQISLGKISTFSLFLEMRLQDEDLNFLNFDFLIEETLHEITDNELAKNMAEQLGFKMLILDNGISDPVNTNSVLKLNQSIAKIEGVMKSWVRTKYANMKNFQEDFPTQFLNAKNIQEKTNLKEEIIKKEFDDIIEFLSLGDLATIFSLKRRTWLNDDYDTTSRIHYLKHVRNQLAHYSGKNIDDDMDKTSLIIASAYCIKVQQFFEKLRQV
jgi:hypothetical protein